MTKNELLLFGERIRSIRESNKFTQEYIAEKLSISIRFYQMVERGEKGISLNTLINISKVLNISIDYLIFGDMPNCDSKNPVIEIMKNLTPKQKLHAETILKEFSEACSTDV